MKEWAVDGSEFFMVDSGPRQARLEKGIYILKECPVRGPYLYRSGDQFNFPYKIYGKDDEFVQRVSKTFDMTKGNLGVLLNGLKGTGKTVTAELICNKLELPVIIVTAAFTWLPNYINKILQEVVILFDEYEKIYTDKEKGDILSVMDGVLNSPWRKVFILTTNNTYINDNLLQRPGRIRYLRGYSDLSLTIIKEIADDLLVHKRHYDAVIDFISHLENITIDIVKAVIQEVNIHNEEPSKFKDIFNVVTIDPRKDIYLIDESGNTYKETLIHSDVCTNPARLTKDHVGYVFYVNGNRIGTISAIDRGKIEVLTTKIVKIPPAKEGEDEKEEVVKEIKKLRITKVMPVHDSFMPEPDYLV